MSDFNIRFISREHAFAPIQIFFGPSIFSLYFFYGVILKSTKKDSQV